MIHLLRNTIAIKPASEPDTTESGLIVIPDVAKGRSVQGVVVMVGPDVQYVQPGDWVMFPAYNGTITELDGEGILILMKDEDITAILGPPSIKVPLYTLQDGQMIQVDAETAINISVSAVSAYDKEWRIKVANRREFTK